jgi:four helix bundle protein
LGSGFEPSVIGRPGRFKKDAEGQKIQGMQKEERTQKGYRKLIVWERAHNFVLEIYRATLNFPKEEMFGITSQLKRAAVSIVANIVEGQAQNTKLQYLQFLNHSSGSLSEVEYYLELVRDLGYISPDLYEKLENQRREIGFLLFQLINSLRRTQRIL